MANTYVYSPLDLRKDSIRLLRLCKGDPGTEIRCELLESFLSESEDVSYEALSYTWGGEVSNDSPRIPLDGIEVPVTCNLLEALRSLRLENTDRLLWVDALCINQNDHCEKGHQVGQMRFVYRNAERVLIWLGHSSPAVDDLMDTINEWGQQSNEELSNIETLWLAATRLLDGSSKATSESHMLTLESLLQRSWFKRVWVIQEVANARVATIICGSKTVSSGVFSAMPHFMNLRMHPHTRAVLDVMPGPLREQSWWHDDRRLITLLIKFSGGEATQEHDRIYALLGIASDAPDFPIEYGRPFRHVADKIISLLVLGDAGQSSLFREESLLRYPGVFLGVANAQELTFRVFELALQHSDKILAKHLIGTSALDMYTYNAITHYKWCQPYYRSIFTLYTGVDEQSYGSLTSVFQAALRHQHYMICNDLCEVFGYIPGDFELKRFLPSMPNSIFRSIVKQILATDSARLISILAHVLETGHLQQLHMLLEHNLVSDKILDEKWLKTALSNKSGQMLKYLLLRRKAAGTRGLSATDLMWEVISRVDNVSMLNTLIDCGADIHSRHGYRTPLREAIHSNRHHVARILAQRGANLSTREENGDTPLHYAEQLDSTEGNEDYQKTIALLLLYGADELAEDNNGRTPWQLNVRNLLGTKRRNKEEMRELLLDVEKDDLHLYAWLLQVREEKNTGGHPKEETTSGRIFDNGMVAGKPSDC